MAYVYIDTTDTLTYGLLAENLEWLDLVETESKKSSHSLHHSIYELLEKGAWISNAFKSETFLATWKDGNFEKQLVPNDQLAESLLSLKENDFKIFSLKGNIGKFDQSVYKMIEEKSFELFSLVLSKKMREKPFYYRQLEEEFKQSPKK